MGPNLRKIRGKGTRRERGISVSDWGPLNDQSIGVSSPKRGGVDPGPPQALVMHVQNPGEDPMALIISPPSAWGPFYTSEELTEAYHELQDEGEIK